MQPLSRVLLCVFLTIEFFFTAAQNEGTWPGAAKFDLDQNTGTDGFGRSVAMTDDWLLVGASGGNKASIHKRTGDTTFAISPTVDFDDKNVGTLGWSVALTDTFAIVGAKTGQAAFIYKYNTGTSTWGNTAATSLTSYSSSPNSNFGRSVAITDTYAMVGAAGAKKAYIFKQTVGSFGADGAGNLVATLDDQATDKFGWSVAMTDEYAIVGARSANKAFIYANTGGTWSTTAVAALTGTTSQDFYFGCDVALTNNWAIVGASSSKKAYMFEKKSGGWNETAVTTFATVSGTNDQFGFSVDLTDTWAIVGADLGNTAHVFQKDGTGSWGATAAFDFNSTASKFGSAVTITDKWASVGAVGAKKAFVFMRCRVGAATCASLVVDSTCAAGYTLNSGATNGPTCEANTCTPAGSVANSNKAGVGSITGTTSQTVAVTCDAGYSGGGTATCATDGTFNTLTCAANTCTPAGSVGNSDKAGVGSITGTTSQTVAVTCDAGYSGGGTATCQTDGNFNASTLTCTVNACTPTHVAFSDKANAGVITGTTGESVAVVCRVGYVSAMKSAVAVRTSAITVVCGTGGTFNVTKCVKATDDNKAGLRSWSPMDVAFLLLGIIVVGLLGFFCFRRNEKKNKNKEVAIDVELQSNPIVKK